ncbi:EcsC family protein [Paenibacillus xerothermodurans]|uniref:EcsC family protein n=1 Tax=Paenibacillus xerothermodurans TaxID=1977292 RepID=A0A2W1N9G9_PAEXE|nr:EcsC family protein [Paenibacillus xerothermodurans]PZE21057.1 EcsC family protein [Paenibacillus xerothermodurans]
MVENREYLQQRLREIVQWENETKDLWFWEKLGRLPFALLDKLTPRVIQDQLATALNEIGKFIQTGGDYLWSEKAILSKLQQKYRDGDQEQMDLALPSAIRTGADFTIADARLLPLTVMDQAADELRANRRNIATVQGAATGFGGLFTIVADIPAMLGLSLKLLQELAVCYGFDPSDERERTFIVKCLQFSSSDFVGKQAILKELADYDHENKQVQVMSQLQGWREVVAAYRDSFGMKKMFQLVPVAGTLFGAYANREALQQVAETGQMLYRKRRIIQRLQQLEAHSTK